MGRRVSWMWGGKRYYGTLIPSRETKDARFARTENGKMMFVYQAHQAFTIWNNVMPKIDDEVIKLLEND